MVDIPITDAHDRYSDQLEEKPAYLRQRGTGRLYIYSDGLYDRGDMDPCNAQGWVFVMGRWAPTMSWNPSDFLTRPPGLDAAPITNPDGRVASVKGFGTDQYPVDYTADDLAAVSDPMRLLSPAELRERPTLPPFERVWARIAAWRSQILFWERGRLWRFKSDRPDDEGRG